MLRLQLFFVLCFFPFVFGGYAGICETLDPLRRSPELIIHLTHQIDEEGVDFWIEPHPEISNDLFVNQTNILHEGIQYNSTIVIQSEDKNVIRINKPLGDFIGHSLTFQLNIDASKEELPKRFLLNCKVATMTPLLETPSQWWQNNKKWSTYPTEDPIDVTYLDNHALQISGSIFTGDSDQLLLWISRNGRSKDRFLRDDALWLIPAEVHSSQLTSIHIPLPDWFHPAMLTGRLLSFLNENGSFIMGPLIMIPVLPTTTSTSAQQSTQETSQVSTTESTSTSKPATSEPVLTNSINAKTSATKASTQSTYELIGSSEMVETSQISSCVHPSD
eukprot:TRINITY_DN9236_c0_g3_i2.p1 TRINITY_DN9236_c0_g3~~TRINITY_DN9236_c0_g3_i2.p1  ORF type:complete len:332 (-),score=42.40 TRINITY_DN9236_c0_g3_i2:104-1099(-)